jgi:hypothetical protein
VRVHLGPRTPDAADDRARHVVDALLRAEAADPVPKSRAIASMNSVGVETG